MPRKTQNAIAQVKTLTLTCPNCREEVSGPVSGSVNLDREDIEHAMSQDGGYIECPACDPDDPSLVRVPMEVRGWFGIKG